MTSRTGLPFRQGMPLLWKLPVLSILLLAGCGGGGGSNSTTGGGSQSQSMTLNPTSLAVSASTVDPAPYDYGSTVGIVNSLPGATYYVFAKTTNSGIASVSVANGSSTIEATGRVNINFKAPGSLGVGTYTDTVTVTACYDQGCAQPLGNTPQTLSVQYTVTNPTPTVSALSPTEVSAGSGAFTLTVTGTEFSPSAVANWNGTPLPTTVSSSTQLTASVSAADVASGGTVSITVTNPGIATSGAATFTVNATLLSSVQPNYITAGGPGFTLNVFGSGFDSSSVVEWNGSGRPTTVVSATQLQIQVLAADIARAGTVEINVLTPNATGGISADYPVTVAAPATWPSAAQAVTVLTNPSHTNSATFSSVTFPTTSTWTVDLGASVGTALIAGGKVFIVTLTSSGVSNLYALDKTTGGTAWGPVAITGTASAAYDNGVVFVSNGVSPTGVQGSNPIAVGSVQAYSASTGTLLWSTSMNGFDNMTTSAPTATGGYVYVTGGASNPATQGTYALNESTGAVSWSTRGPEAANSPPAVNANGVYVDFTCGAFAYNPTTGAQLWASQSRCASGGNEGSVAALVGSTVYVPNILYGYNGNVLNAGTGVSTGTYTAVTPPAFDSQNGYFVQPGSSGGSSGSLEAIGLTSNTVSWTFAPDNDSICAETVVSQYVIAEGCDGTLFALNAATGQQTWTLKSLAPPIWNFTPQPPFDGPVAGEGVLVVPAGTKLVTYTLATSP